MCVILSPHVFFRDKNTALLFVFISNFFGEEVTWKSWRLHFLEKKGQGGAEENPTPPREEFVDRVSSVWRSRHKEHRSRNGGKNWKKKLFHNNNKNNAFNGLYKMDFFPIFTLSNIVFFVRTEFFSVLFRSMVFP